MDEPDGPSGRDTGPQVVGHATSDDLPDFLAADEDEPPLKRCRAPSDPVPYDPGEDEGPCFASIYQAEEEEEGQESLGAAELKHAFKAMHALIDR